MRTEFFDSSLPPAHISFPQEKQREINESCLANHRFEKVWFVLLFHWVIGVPFTQK